MIIQRQKHNHKEITSNLEDKMPRNLEYLEALEEEHRKIQVFQRELPLCLELVTQAIEECKQKLSGRSTENNFHGQSECSEQTSTEGPVLEEFIPLKRASSSSDDDSDEHQSHKWQKNNDEKAVEASKKSDWLRSVHLWNQSPDQPAKEDTPKKVSVAEVKRNGRGGAFHPFQKEKNVGITGAAAQPQGNRSSGPAPAASSTAESGGGRKKEDKEGQGQKKSRRCWSPELHKRFLLALQQLGGSHVATPKQIRELMKVDGLTIDEVKSHLQKYRLHNRRPNPSVQNNHHPQATPFVVVGGIWMPPPEYTAMASTASSGKATGGASASVTHNGIYAPVATLAAPIRDVSSGKQRQQQQWRLDDRDGGLNGGGRGSHSSRTTTSSTDTITASSPKH